MEEGRAELLGGDWLVAGVTFLLVIVTALLVWATYLMAKIARQEGRHRKIETTAAAWMGIRPNLSLPPDLAGKNPDEIEEAGKKALPSIMILETYAACVNSGAYDIKTFNRMSGAWFLQQFKWSYPYIEKQRDEPLQQNQPPYLPIGSASF